MPEPLPNAASPAHRYIQGSGMAPRRNAAGFRHHLRVVTRLCVTARLAGRQRLRLPTVRSPPPSCTCIVLAGEADGCRPGSSGRAFLSSAVGPPRLSARPGFRRRAAAARSRRGLALGRPHQAHLPRRKSIAGNGEGGRRRRSWVLLKLRRICSPTDWLFRELHAAQAAASPNMPVRK
jgi:hypothetical protein